MDSGGDDVGEDDIEIDEHDIMAEIRKVFPDMSIVKNEVEYLENEDLQVNVGVESFDIHNQEPNSSIVIKSEEIVFLAKNNVTASPVTVTQENSAEEHFTDVPVIEEIPRESDRIQSKCAERNESNCSSENMNIVQEKTKQNDINNPETTPLVTSVNVDSSEIKLYRCDICWTYYHDATVLESHLEQTHDVIVPYTLLKPELFNPNCKLCPERNESIVSYNTHLTQTHLNLSESKNKSHYACDSDETDIESDLLVVDSSKSENVTNLLQDESDLRTESKMFHKCYICGAYLITSKGYMKHMLKNHNARKFPSSPKVEFDPTCVVCDKHILDQRKYYEHLQYHHRDVLYKKMNCSMLLKYEDDEPGLRLTQSLNEDDDVESENDKRDNEAGKVHVTPDDFKKFFKCNVCGAYFVTHKRFVKHMHKNHNATNLPELQKVGFNPVCAFCEKRFDNFVMYHYHLKYHHKAIFCKKVNHSKDAKGKSTLVQTHIESEDNQENSCRNNAGKDTISSNDDTSHTKYYKCYVCGSYLITARGYLNHLSRSHNVTRLKKRTKVDFNPQCGICNKNLLTYKKYHSHLLNRHKTVLSKKVNKIRSTNQERASTTSKKVVSSQSKRIKCHICGVCFLTSVGYIQHMYKNHNVTKLSAPQPVDFIPKCGICNKNCGTYEKHRAHLQSNHKNLVYKKIKRLSVSSVQSDTQSENEGNSKSRQLNESQNSGNFFKCHICERYFSTTLGYTKHMSRYHNITELTTPRKVNFNSVCGFCKKDCGNYHNYGCHLQRFHAEKIYKKVNPSNDDDKKSPAGIEIEPKNDIHIDNSTQANLVTHKRHQINFQGYYKNMVGKKINSNSECGGQTSNSKKFFKCHVCGLYFVTAVRYSKHMYKNHKVAKLSAPKTVNFDPVCKFCNKNLLTYGLHRVHMNNCHENIVYKKINRSNGDQKKSVVKSKHDKTDSDDAGEGKTSNKNDFLQKEYFKCHFCGMYFSRIVWYKNHMRKNHNVAKPSVPRSVSFNPLCGICHKNLVTFKKYYQHLHKCHRDVVYKKNDNIKKMARQTDTESENCKEVNHFQINQLSDHVQEEPSVDNDGTLVEQTHNSMSEQFSDSGQAGTSWTDDCMQGLHNKESLSRKMFRCHVCGLYFITSFRYARHMRKNHDVTNVTKPPKIYFSSTCILCNKDIKNNTIGYNYHVKKCHSEVLYKKVNLCDKREDVEADIESVNDIRKSDSGNLFRCHVCGIYFKTSHRYVKHIRKNHNVTNVTIPPMINFSSVCMICDKNLNNYTTGYKQHMRDYHKDVLYKKVEVGEGTGSINLHSNDPEQARTTINGTSVETKYYKCHVCGVYFRTTARYIRHMYKHHNVAEPSIPQAVDFNPVCDVCKTYTITNKIHRSHLQHYHQNLLFKKMHQSVNEDKVNNSNRNTLNDSDQDETSVINDDLLDISELTDNTTTDRLSDSLLSGTSRMDYTTVTENCRQNQDNEESNTRKFFKCHICGSYRISPKEYITHMEKNHYATELTIPEKIHFNPLCDICNDNFMDFESYHTHLKNNHRYALYKKVDILGSDGKPARQGNTNTKKINESSRIWQMFFKCHICGCYFVTPSRYLKHMYKNHNTTKLTVPQKVVYNPVCGVCDMRLTSREMYNAHVIKFHTHLVHINGNNLDKTKLRTDARIKPLKKIESNDPKRPEAKQTGVSTQYFECDICGGYYKFRGRYEKHMRINHNVHKLPAIKKVNFRSDCNICKKSYSTYLAFNFHLFKQHNDVYNKKNNCLNSDSLFERTDVRSEISEQFESNVHVEADNTNIIKQNIDILIDSSSSDRLIDPLRTSEKDNNVEINNEKHSHNDESADKFFKCNICGGYFETCHRYMKHMHQNHNETEETAPEKVNFYPMCNICDKRFGDFESYNTHLHNRHPNLFYKTEITPGPVEVYIVNDVIEEEIDGQVDSTTNDRLRENTDQSIYRCDVCWTYYNESTTLETHLEHIHEIKLPSESFKPVLFDPKCKYCPDIEENIHSYNEHIMLIHHDRILKGNENKTDCADTAETTTDKELAQNVYQCMKCDVHFLSKATASNHADHMEMLINWKCDTCKRIFKIEDKVLHGKQHKTCQKINVYVVGTQYILKDIIFQCMKCDVHFLSATTASNHTDHMEMLINWKCETCKRIFKKEDKILHETQHNSSQKINAYVVDPGNPKLLSRMLFKCSKCNVHFTETTFLNHTNCGVEAPQATFCRLCNFLIGDSIQKLHESSHRDERFVVNDYRIIEAETICNQIIGLEN